MYIYEMDPASIVDETRADTIPSTDRQTDGWRDNVKLIYFPFNNNHAAMLCAKSQNDLAMTKDDNSSPPSATYSRTPL